ncbi:MAG: PQQ-binding-like beta-propeller repeat protein [Armatimonadetes bacterium]|nr:PQQ-binding-like beta-propeller repeat protein [Armatimonadota bacterium]
MPVVDEPVTDHPPMRALLVFLALLALLVPANAPGAMPALPSHVGRGGDWPMRGRDEAHTAHNPNERWVSPASVPRLVEVWRFRADEAVTGSPVVVADTVYFGTWKGTFYAVDLRTGQLRWRRALGALERPAHGMKQLGVIGTAAVAGGRVYVGTALAEVWSLDVRTGAVLWKAKVGNPDISEIVASPPLVFGGLVYVGIVGIVEEPEVKGRAIALDASTGQVRWVFQTVKYTTGGGAGIFGSFTPDARRGVVYLTTGNPKHVNPPAPGPDRHAESILALDARSGRLAWAFGPTRPHDAMDFDFLTTPNLFTIARREGGRTVAVDVVGAGQKDGMYYAVEAATGRLLWKTSTELPDHTSIIVGSAGVAYGRIFFGTQDVPKDAKGWSENFPGRMFALDAATGRVAWVRRSASMLRGAPAIAGGVVFAGDHLGFLRAFDARDGRELWQAKVGGFLWKEGVTVARGLLLAGVGPPANAVVAFTVR